MLNRHSLAKIFWVEHLAIHDVADEVPLGPSPVWNDPTPTCSRHSGDGDVHVTMSPSLLLPSIEHHTLECLA